MTKYTDDSDNHFNSFISSCVQELKNEGISYAYTKEQVNIIKNAMQKRYNQKVICRENECGYTLRLGKEKL